jgi:hypothetical protein
MKIDFVGLTPPTKVIHKEHMNTKYTKVTKHTKGMGRENISSEIECNYYITLFYGS